MTLILKRVKKQNKNNVAFDALFVIFFAFLQRHTHALQSIFRIIIIKKTILKYSNVSLTSAFKETKLSLYFIQFCFMKEFCDFFYSLNTEQM